MIVPVLFVPACYIIDPDLDYSCGGAGSYGSEFYLYVQCSRLTKKGVQCRAPVAVMEYEKRRDNRGRFAGDLDGFTGRAWCNSHFEQHEWAEYSCDGSYCGGVHFYLGMKTYHFHPIYRLNP